MAGVTESTTYNMEDLNQCGFVGTGDQPNTDPLLLGLANYGGPANTVALPALSPAVNMGNPAGCTDADGNAITRDERGALRSDRCDIGAFEYVTPPHNTAPPKVSGTALDGATVTCRTGSWSGGQPLSFRFQWLKDGSPVNGATGTSYAIPAGTAHHTLACLVTAQNFTATTSATSAPVTVGTGSLSNLKVTPGKSSLAGRTVNGRCVKPTKKNNGNPHCTRPVKLKISYTLNAGATVKFTFELRTAGRTVNGKCVRQTAKNHGKKKCTLIKKLAGSITKSGSSGANSFTFDGKLGGHKLNPGTYQLTATPSGGGSQTVTFKIMR